MTVHEYAGPSVYGYETDHALRRVAATCVHTSPLATLGGKDAGGMNVYVRELACHVARLGVPIDVFTRRTDPSVSETVPLCPGVNVVNITAGPPTPLPKDELFPYLPEFATEAALYSLRQGVRYDVVHAHYWLSGWAAHLLRRYWDTPFVQMFHTTAHMKNAVADAPDRESSLRLTTEQRLVTLADSLIAANPDESADLIWRHGAPTRKVCTIPPGVDLELFRPLERAACRAELDFSPHQPIVLFVGRIDPIKGIDNLVRALARLRDRYAADACAVIVGGDLDSYGQPVGPLADFAAQAQALGIADRCRFVGAQPQDRLPLYYGAADVVVVPSRYESFGLVAVEAMACARPVVASRVGGLIFTIEEDETGYLVPWHDADALAAALASVLADSGLRDRLGDRARQAAERFAWPTVASSILHVYARLAEGHRANLCCEEEFYAS